MLAFIAVHEDRGGFPSVRCTEVVFHPAVEPQDPVETLCGRHVVLAEDYVPKALVAGDEATVHRASRMEWFCFIHLRCVEDLRWITTRVGEFQQTEHPALGGLRRGGDLESDTSRVQLGAHLLQLDRAGYSP